MLKHVTYRSTPVLGRPSDFSCRSANVPSAGGNNNSNVDGLKSYLVSPVSGENRITGSSGSALYHRGSIPSPNPSVASSSSPNQGSKSISLNPRESLSPSLGSPSWRYSSTTSLSDGNSDRISKTPVKVFLRRLRPDMEYKTLSLTSQTTCRELILSLLTKFRLRHRDPNLFFVMMEVTVRAPTDSAPIKRLLVLDDDDRPAELQQCRPKGEANFIVGVRRGGLVRVHDAILMPGSQYKSLLVSHHTTAEELVRLLLNCYNRRESSKFYCLYEVCFDPYQERELKRGENPIQIQATWSKDDKAPSKAFVLRHNTNYALQLISKPQRNLDQSNTDTESENGAANTTRLSIVSTLSSASVVSSSSSVSALSNLSSSSSGVSSDESLARSSSGVSSGSSFMSTQKLKPLSTSTPKASIRPAVRNSRIVCVKLTSGISFPSKKIEDSASNESCSSESTSLVQLTESDDRPLSRVDLRPPSRVDLRPSSRLDLRPLSRVDLRPDLPHPKVSFSLRKSLPFVLAKEESLPSFCHFRTKTATIRSLSKSFSDICSASGTSEKSKSYHNLCFIDNTNKELGVGSPPEKRDLQFPPKIRSLTVFPLKNHPSCSMKCKSCFYI